jgi:hypothetical protein
MCFGGVDTIFTEECVGVGHPKRWTTVEIFLFPISFQCLSPLSIMGKITYYILLLPTLLTLNTSRQITGTILSLARVLPIIPHLRP